MLTQLQQFQELINKANNVLICFKKDFTNDGVAGALGMSNFLTKQNKKHSIVCADYKTLPELAWLDKNGLIENKITNLRQFIISLDLKHRKINEFSYDVQDDKLKIYILPEENMFKSDDLQTSSSNYYFDLILTLDAPDLESLAEIYLNAPEFFFETPIINIDHQAQNEKYGQLNVVDLNASSVCEVIYNVINTLDNKYIDEELATLLLAGMISKTQSFKSNFVTPRTLQTASNLIAFGADREKIISNLYFTRKLNVLKLWGRALARLEYDKSLNLVWASVPYSDFIKSDANEKDIKGLVEEMIINSPEAEIMLLVYEKKDAKIGVEFWTNEKYDARQILGDLGARGTKTFVSFEVENKNLNEVESEVISEIREKIQ
ncbi:DHH family phosphoesterase [Candidatus Parcubacteria bacterium]|nr:DHH family phosphoesterase [Candidatus Parcubacteria bacterium]